MVNLGQINTPKGVMQLINIIDGKGGTEEENNISKIYICKENKTTLRHVFSSEEIKECK